MATLRESLQSEIDTLEKALAAKRAALAAVPNVLDTPISELRAMWRAIAAHIFGPSVAAPAVVAAPAPSIPDAVATVVRPVAPPPSDGM